ncbi:hypothetical protein C2E23DRAFT_882092 [Lenzites betulinus]|nr:hypothetical protein C2E23DRAFT_882092 [Lenzites betulinus]
MFSPPSISAPLSVANSTSDHPNRCEVILPNIPAQHIRGRPECPTIRHRAETVLSPFAARRPTREVPGEPVHALKAPVDEVTSFSWRASSVRVSRAELAVLLFSLSTIDPGCGPPCSAMQHAEGPDVRIQRRDRPRSFKKAWWTGRSPHPSQAFLVFRHYYCVLARLPRTGPQAAEDDRMQLPRLGGMICAPARPRSLAFSAPYSAGATRPATSPSRPSVFLAEFDAGDEVSVSLRTEAGHEDKPRESIICTKAISTALQFFTLSQPLRPRQVYLGRAFLVTRDKQLSSVPRASRSQCRVL